MNKAVNQSTVQLIYGDITEIEAEAIVNAANSHLLHGGGVAGSIARKGGQIIQRESTRWVEEHGPVPVGSATITGAGKLRARHIIHAVGPRVGEGDEERKLQQATLNSLKLADEHRLTSVAFPAISTGIFGYPVDSCARIMVSTTIEYLKGDTALRQVIFCLYDRKTFDVFRTVLENS